LGYAVLITGAGTTVTVTGVLVALQPLLFCTVTVYVELAVKPLNASTDDAVKPTWPVALSHVYCIIEVVPPLTEAVNVVAPPLHTVTEAAERFATIKGFTGIETVPELVQPLLLSTVTE
jgi:hypothetical protein